MSTLADDWRDQRRQEPGFAGVEWNDTVEVDTTTLDALIAEYGLPAFVKLDIEGGEAAALAGLSQPVRTVSFEFLPQALDAVRACGQQLEALGPYRYNWTPAESHRLASDTWLTLDALVGRADDRHAARRRRRNTGALDIRMTDRHTRPVNSPRQILTASLMGTAIEFFDFYIYATAAVLVFPALFFPSSDPATGTLASLATFAIAFVARPIGSALFGHFGDRVGRKTTLVAALLTMGVSTVAIGLVPTYATIGIAAPILLALCRFGQGLGLGGEWGGAILLATENAPPGKRGVVRHVSAARRAARLLLLGRHLPAHLAPAHQRAVLRLGLAHSVPRQRRAGRRRASTCG